MTSARKNRGERGLGRTTMEIIDAATEILRVQNPMTVRGVCYQLFNRKLIPEMSRKNTSKVSRVLVSARERDLVPWEWIVDETRPIERAAQWGDIEEYSRDVVRSYRKDYWASSPYKLFIVSEKSTIGGVLRPITDNFGVSFLSVHGFNSATKVYELAQESLDNQAMILLYVGDYDPSGMYMSEVDLPNRLKQYGGHAIVCRLALDRDDLGNLPTFTAAEKRQDPRYRWFVSRHGETCAELDAMSPNELRQRVAGAIEEFIDPQGWERHKLAEHAEVETIKTICARMATP
jgi:hypothetical protein